MREQLRIILQGAATWNEWRAKNPRERITLDEANLCGEDLRGADLHKADLREADLTEANLSEANLRWANLSKANLCWSDLSNADLYKADLSHADICTANLHKANFYLARLVGANLSGSDLCGASIRQADLNGANLHMARLDGVDLRGSKLTNTILVAAELGRANLTGCRIYGISAWGLKLNETIQESLIITPEDKPVITVDNLEVAQFIYLLLHNENIRHIIDTITSKVVLILGRFTPERKVVLDSIKDELRKRGYIPVLFDFEGPSSRDITETISTLAHMARFVIADITDAKSIPAELEHIVPLLPSVPIKPIILSSDYEYALFEHIRKFPWVLETYQYENQEELITSLEERVITPTETKANELRKVGR